MNRSLNVSLSWVSSIVRGLAGLSVTELGKRPEKLLELYEFEACPFCRAVREAITELDLSALVHPCPKGGTRFRPVAERLGGKAQFPFLVDPNTGKSMYESGDIVRYLHAEYGTGRIPVRERLRPVDRVLSGLASAPRAGASTAVPSAAPERPLELWSFENSPYCRIAREALCQLELPYILHNVGKKSPSRPAFVERSGKMQVPYLSDPNTGAAMFESADIVDYLMKTYRR